MDHLTKQEAGRVDGVIGELVAAVDAIFPVATLRLGVVGDELEMCGETELASAFHRFADAEDALESALQAASGSVREVEETSSGEKVIRAHRRAIRGVLVRMPESESCLEILDAVADKRRASPAVVEFLEALAALRAIVDRRMRTSEAEEHEMRQRVVVAQERIRLVEHDLKVLKDELVAVRGIRARDQAADDSTISRLTLLFNEAQGAITDERNKFAAEHSDKVQAATTSHGDAREALAKQIHTLGDELAKQRDEHEAAEVDARKRVVKLEATLAEAKADFDATMMQRQRAVDDAIRDRKEQLPLLRKLSAYYDLVRIRSAALSRPSPGGGGRGPRLLLPHRLAPVSRWVAANRRLALSAPPPVQVERNLAAVAAEEAEEEARRLEIEKEFKVRASVEPPAARVLLWSARPAVPEQVGRFPRVQVMARAATAVQALWRGIKARRELGDLKKASGKGKGKKKGAK